MISDKDYDKRVELGKAKEKEILNILKRNGIKVAEASPQEDMYDKIDAWIEWNGTKAAVQVKYREGGDDVIFEILKDLDLKTPGRDMGSKAAYYLVQDRQGVVRMFSTSDLKKMSKAIYDHVLTDLQKNPRKTEWGSPNAVANVKITIDRAHGNRKLMAFFNPKKLKVIGEWQ